MKPWNTYFMKCSERNISQCVLAFSYKVDIVSIFKQLFVRSRLAFLRFQISLNNSFVFSL